MISVPLIWYRMRVTRWKRFFAVNGPREWIAPPHFIGFRELQNERAYQAQWTAQDNRGEFYYTAVYVNESSFAPVFGSESHAGFLKAKQDNARESLETYLDPHCRCRVGFHWKCAIHKKWVG